VVGGYAARHDAGRRPSHRQSLSCYGLTMDKKTKGEHQQSRVTTQVKRGTDNNSASPKAVAADQLVQRRR
jgi:hypothetical protein